MHIESLAGLDSHFMIKLVGILNSQNGFHPLGSFG